MREINKIMPLLHTSRQKCILPVSLWRQAFWIFMPHTLNTNSKINRLWFMKSCHQPVTLSLISLSVSERGGDKVRRERRPCSCSSGDLGKPPDTSNCSQTLTFRHYQHCPQTLASDNSETVAIKMKTTRLLGFFSPQTTLSNSYFEFIKEG